MADEIQLEWSFEPADLFEELAELLIDGCTFIINAGTVTGRAPFDGDPATDLQTFCNALHQTLDAVFIAAQSLEHKAYQLSGPRNGIRLSNGVRNFFIVTGPGAIKMALGVVDVRQTDAAGNVIVDTRRDRIAKRKDLAQRAAKHFGNEAVRSILRSYSAAVIDPRNELIHLYEIQETLSRRLGGKKKARATLAIGEDDWDALVTIACDEPLLQGRHRGRFPGKLVAATDEQLSRVRVIARTMIEKYLAHVDNKAPP
jgi:hypothetical protein